VARAAAGGIGVRASGAVPLESARSVRVAGRAGAGRVDPLFRSIALADPTLAPLTSSAALS
jgi:hypothetical protein